MSMQDAPVYFMHFSSYDSGNRIKQCAVSTRSSKSVGKNNPIGQVSKCHIDAQGKKKLSLLHCNFWTLCSVIFLLHYSSFRFKMLVLLTETCETVQTLVVWSALGA